MVPKWVSAGTLIFLAVCCLATVWHKATMPASEWSAADRVEKYK